MEFDTHEKMNKFQKEMFECVSCIFSKNITLEGYEHICEIHLAGDEMKKVKKVFITSLISGSAYHQIPQEEIMRHIMNTENSEILDECLLMIFMCTKIIL